MNERYSDNLDGCGRPILAVLIAMIGIVLSCTIHHYERKAIRTNDLELNEQIEAYYHTVWGKENNRPGERDSIMEIIRRYK